LNLFILPTSFTVSLSQASRISLVPRVSDSSFRNCDNEGWTLVTHRRAKEQMQTYDKTNYNKNLDGEEDN